MRFGLVVMGLLLAVFGHSVQAEQLRVGLIQEGRKPYFWTDNQGQHHGLYIEILQRISKKLDQPLVFNYLPQARIRLYMKYDYLDIEPGIAKSWRNEQQEIDNSVYSIPFLISEEVFVYNRNRGPSPQADESKNTHLKYCSMIGFNKLYDDDNQEVRSEEQLLEMVNLQRCDYILMPKLVFDYWAEGRIHSLATTDVIKTYQLRLRLHKSKANLLPDINILLAKMAAENEIDSLLQTMFKDAREGNSQ